MTPSTFLEHLNVSVTLTANATSATVDGGNVKQLNLDLELYGFTGTVRAWVFANDGEDAFYPLVSGTELLSLRLTLGKALYQVSPAPNPLTLEGIVTLRRLREIPSADLRGRPVLYREYELEFQDSAQALWSHHRPTAVYANTTLRDVVRENTPKELTTQLKWSGLDEARNVVCLGLGDDQASFHDLLFWIADREGAHVWYDYTAQRLVIDDAKPSIGSPTNLALGALSGAPPIQVCFAPRRLEAVCVLNSREGTTQRLEVEQPDAVADIRRDYLIHTPLNAPAKARQAVEARRAAAGRYDVQVACGAYPETYLAPGVVLKLADEFSDRLAVSGQPLRLLSMSLAVDATNQLPEFDLASSTTEYSCSVALRLEPDDDVRWRGPTYSAPRYPFEVEGRVLSAAGNTGDRSYTIYEHSDFYGSYKVYFPLWDATVTIPVWPDFVPGHLYFPVPKDSRVFMSMQFDSARIARFLEWGKDAAVPNASQGNHLLLGQNDQSQTSIKHWYVDNVPQLILSRVHAADRGTLTVDEGTLTLELTEEDGGDQPGTSDSANAQENE